METLLQKIYAGTIALSTVFASWFGFVPENYVNSLEQRVSQLEQTTQLGAYNSSGGGTYRLKSSAGITDTVLNLSAFKEPVSNIPYSMSYLNTAIGYGTIEPNIPDKSEFISFTGITQNTDGSAQLTGVSRGLSRTTGIVGCAASTTLAIRHGGQSTFILSDSPCHFSEYAVKRNDESISGAWTFPTPTAASNPATKTYVDNLVNGGAVTTDSLVPTAVAGETITQGQIVYYNRYSLQWFKASASLASTSIGVMLGVAQGAATVGVNISGGVMLKGLDSKNPGIAADTVLYLGNTSGATSTSAGTFERMIGIRKSTSQLYFNPEFRIPTINFSDGRISNDLISSTTLFGTPFIVTASSTSINNLTAAATTTFTANVRGVNLIAVSTTSPYLIDSTTETTLISGVVPAGYFSYFPSLVRSKIFYKAMGANSGGAVVNVKLYYGGTVIASTSTLPIADGNEQASVQFDTYATTSASIQLTSIIADQSGWATTDSKRFFRFSTSSPSTVNGNIAQPISVTATLVNPGGTSLMLEYGTIEKID